MQLIEVQRGGANAALQEYMFQCLLRHNTAVPGGGQLRLVGGLCDNLLQQNGLRGKERWHEGSSNRSAYCGSRAYRP
jgi:hypothetical protein